ncbi:MAG: hypothetical protein ACO22Z_11090, partial [Paracoccaceae bacterium]
RNRGDPTAIDVEIALDEHGALLRFARNLTGWADSGKGRTRQFDQIYDAKGQRFRLAQENREGVSPDRRAP